MIIIVSIAKLFSSPLAILIFVRRLLSHNHHILTSQFCRSSSSLFLLLIMMVIFILKTIALTGITRQIPHLHRSISQHITNHFVILLQQQLSILTRLFEYFILKLYFRWIRIILLSTGFNHSDNQLTTRVWFSTHISSLLSYLL